MGGSVRTDFIRTCKPGSEPGYRNKRTDSVDYLSGRYDDSTALNIDVLLTVTKTQSANSGYSRFNIIDHIRCTQKRLGRNELARITAIVH